MSHFTVLITNTDQQSPDEQLEPYYEQGDDSDYFMERQIEIAAEDMEEEANRIHGEYLEWHKKCMKLKSEAKRKLAGDTTSLSNWEISQLEDKAKYDGEKREKAKEIAEMIADKNFQDIVQDWHGGEIDEDGNLFFVSNPNAKWDWWTVGGRWRGFFKLKKGADGTIGKPGVFDNEANYDADIAKVKDIDWEGMKADKLARAEKWWAEYERKLNLGDETMNPYFDYGIEKGQTKEDYLKKQASVAPFAVLHDGEWFERGEMGWWAIVSNEKKPEDWEEAFWNIINSLDPESEVTVVDCHI